MGLAKNARRHSATPATPMLMRAQERVDTTGVGIPRVGRGRFWTRAKESNRSLEFFFNERQIIPLMRTRGNMAG